MTIKKFVIIASVAVLRLVLAHDFFSEQFMMPKLKFDSSCLSHSSDISREPKLISLTTRKNNVMLTTHFDVPFLKIPVNKSIDGLMNTMQSVTTSQGFDGLRFNYPAMFMIAVFGAGGTILKGINYYLNSTNSSILEQFMQTPRTNINLLLEKFQKDKVARGDDELLEVNKKDKKREPKFISFEQKNGRVYMKINLIFPFLTIPVKRSFHTAMNSMQGLTTKFGALQFNYAAIGMGVFATISGLLAQTIVKYKKGYLPNKLKGKSEDKNKFYSKWLTDLLEQTFDKYKNDSRDCIQKMVCLYTQGSIENVKSEQGNRLEKFVEGFTRSQWTMELVANTTIESGILAARSGYDCSKHFEKCKIDQKYFDNVLSIFLSK